MGQGNFHMAPMLLLTSVGSGDFSLEPYEAGWATEAIAFVYVREIKEKDVKFTLRAQISVDGERWIDTGERIERINAVQGYYLPMKNFGNWIRLAGEVTGAKNEEAPCFVVDVYWSLKG